MRKSSRDDNGMYQQLSIFDLVIDPTREEMSIAEAMKKSAEKENSDKHPMLLKVGETVYRVIMADVIECKVEGTYELSGSRQRGYWLNHGVTWNDELGVSAFKSREDAERKASEFLQGDTDVILASELYEPEDIVKAAFTRKSDNKKMIAYWGIYPNGDLISKEFMTFQYIIRFGNVKKAAAYRNERLKSCMLI